MKVYHFLNSFFLSFPNFNRPLEVFFSIILPFHIELFIFKNFLQAQALFNIFYLMFFNLFMDEKYKTEGFTIIVML